MGIRHILTMLSDIWHHAIDFNIYKTRVWKLGSCYMPADDCFIVRLPGSSSELIMITTEVVREL